MEKYIEILEKCPLFEGVKREDLLRMLSCLGARVASFDKRYTIFAEGRPLRAIGIVLSGSVQVERVDIYGNRSILTKVHPTELFGEAFACAGVEAMPVSIVASEPCEIMLINCDHILHTCSNNCGFHQQLIYNLMKDLARKTLQIHQKLEVTSKKTTRDKLMEYLMIMAKKNGSNSFDIPYDRQELADYLEVDRSGLSAEISKLRQEGVLESRKKRFVLL
ncbi:MAG: Crp/Fnr family transcriptional regulator [Clostridia bacterium]|nr:Crp/Fnr family transcriptional regulator [Clostridia bacterium]